MEGMKAATLVPTANTSRSSGGLARVVVTFPMTPSARDELATALGPDFEVDDVRTAPVESDLVLCRPCSPGAIRSLKRMFPTARVIVVESPAGFGSVGLAGPVSRMRDAGVDLYMTGASVSLLASAIRGRVGPAAVDATLVSYRLHAA
jgi:hypothetical protein